MRVLSRPIITQFCENHPRYTDALNAWYRIARHLEARNFDQLKQTFGAADVVGRCVVFNIHGNDVRLIAWVDYPRQKLFIRHILTHNEYDKNAWKADCER